MVAEAAVGDFKVCLKSYKLSDEKMSQQQALLDKIVATKSEEDADAQTVRLVNLLDTLTESLLKLTINVTDASRAKLLKCEEEVASANSFVQKEGMGASRQPIGKVPLSRVVGIGKFKESSFREWIHTLMTSLHCMDRDIYDEITKLERT